MTQNIERRHAGGNVQRVMNRGQDDTNAEADAARVLTHRRKGEVRGAVVRPHGAKMMLRKPYALEALPFSKGNLLQCFIDALGFTGRGPGFGHLDLIKQANSHRTVPLCAGISSTWAGTRPDPRPADLRSADQCHDWASTPAWQEDSSPVDAPAGLREKIRSICSPRTPTPLNRVASTETPAFPRRGFL